MSIKIFSPEYISIKHIPGISKAQASFFQKRQVQTANRLLWYTQPFNIANGFLINLVFFQQFNNLFANILTLFITVTACAWLVTANYFSPVNTHTDSKSLGWKTHSCFALVMSSVFGIFCAYVFANALGEEKLLIAAMITGMVAGGAVALSTLPYVAFAWVLPLTISIMIVANGLSDVVIGLLLSLLAVTFSILMLVVIFLMHRMSIQNITSQVNALNLQLDAEKQSETIGLLLRDFEEQVSDWLWELDACGEIMHIPVKIIKMAGLSETEKWRMSFSNLFLQLFTSKEVEQKACIQRLEIQFASKKAFSDIIIPACLNTESWLKISAKPLFNSQGDFYGWRGLCADVTTTFLNTRRIEHLANFDTLTGLANRYQFNQSISKLCEQNTPFALVLLDLDNFKYVNDTFGHAEGDQLLQQVANRMQLDTLKTDLVCRLGGDEFAIISQQVSSIKNTLKTLLSNLRVPAELTSVSLEVDASIGISLFPGDASNYKSLLSKADIAMYNAKSSPTDSIVFFAPEMERRSHERSEMILHLKKATKQNELSLIYQPQINIKTRTVIGFEALMRWKNPELGHVSPELFIPLAEESGLIVEMGYWALETACKQALLWENDLPVAVNVSGLQLLSTGFENTVINVLKNTGLSPSRLHLEVTESSIVTKIGQANSTLTKLQAIGVGIALDDFGTGFSSLSYLQKLSIDTLKIDRSFIQGLDNIVDLPSSTAIIDIILKLADVLNLSVMVEGVESQFQLQQLVGLGCENIQGYLFSPPIAAESIKEFIEQFTYIGD